MRDILFKAQRIDNGEWVEGQYFHWIRYGKRIPMIGDGVQNGSINGFEVKPETICQYTGLIDKNKVKIFEGDYDEDYSTVHWCDRGYGWTLAIYDIPTKDFIECHCYHCEGNFELQDVIDNFEVIGNIHDKNEDYE